MTDRRITYRTTPTLLSSINQDPKAKHPTVEEPAAFLVGFLSQTEPDAAYVHFVGVDPHLHGQGIGRALYRAFFALARSHGRRYVHCITSPQNTNSRAFHIRLGFTASAVKPDYDGPGLDRVAFTIDLSANPVR